MEIIIAIATILGGIGALWFFYDKFFSSKPDLGIQNEGIPEKTIENKIVNSIWWESSELKKSLEAEGYNTFSWSNSDRVEERIDKGYEVIFDENKDNKILCRSEATVRLATKEAVIPTLLHSSDPVLLR